MPNLPPPNPKNDVFIVGAGPVGLLLAGLLAGQGVAVSVLEQRSTPHRESRASQLNARTMEILDGHGLVGCLGTLERVSAGHFGGIRLDVSQVPSHLPGYWKIPQWRTEAALTKWATKLGATILRDHEVFGMEVGDREVALDVHRPADTVRLTSSWVVGCDGEHSVVRRLAGIDFVGHDAERELLRADLVGVELPSRSFERHPAGLAISARRPDGVTRVMVHHIGRAPGLAGREVDFAAVCDAWRAVTGEDLSRATPLWVDAFGDANRQAATYRQGRVLLAGDACHASLPAAGQALNLGLQDADNLAWKLAATVAGWAPPSLLDSYDTERRSVGADTLSLVEAQAQLLLGDGEVDPLRSLLADIFDLPGATEDLAKEVSGLATRYPVNPGHPLAGTRLPHLVLRTARGSTSTTAELGWGRTLLLELRGQGGTGGCLHGLAARWHGRVRHIVGHPDPDHRSPLPVNAEALIVRPDGTVAWAGSCHEQHDAGVALAALLGPPKPSPDPVAGTPLITATRGGPVLPSKDAVGVTTR